MQDVGFSVEHEHACTPWACDLGAAADVDVSWLAAGYDLDSVSAYMVVRHPLAVAATLRDSNVFKRSNDYCSFASETLGYDLLDREYAELDYWLDWNILAESKTLDWYKVEEPGDVYLLMFELSNLVLPGVTISMVTAPETWKRKAYDVDGYPRIDELREGARFFGYTVEV